MRLLSGDKVFLVVVVTLTLVGLAIFASASLGLLARGGMSSLSQGLVAQTAFGLGVGGFAFLVARFVSLAYLKRWSPYLFIFTLIGTALVFVPGLGFSAGGATRWIDLGFTTLQPAEFLKVGFVLALAWWLAPRARQLGNPRYGLLPFLGLLAVPSALLLAQPNTSTTMLLVVTGGAMYFTAGAPWRDFGILAVGVIVILGGLVMMRPYVLERFQTFLDPGANALGSGYQIQQALIAIGSGGVMGRGFGQSVEKFSYLPEADGDSVFAVYAEETGFVGAIILLLLFVALSARGIVIAGSASELYGGLIAIGFSFLIVFQAFTNMSAMLGIIPLTGLPLPFISHGGTALAATLLMCGLILNVAAHRKR